MYSFQQFGNFLDVSHFHIKQTKKIENRNKKNILQSGKNDNTSLNGYIKQEETSLMCLISVVLVCIVMPLGSSRRWPLHWPEQLCWSSHSSCWCSGSSCSPRTSSWWWCCLGGKDLRKEEIVISEVWSLERRSKIRKCGVSDSPGAPPMNTGFLASVELGCRDPTTWLTSESTSSWTTLASRITEIKQERMHQFS